MAAKPIERAIKKQIADQGGWERLLERYASGETIADIARTLFKPDGHPISRNFLSMLLHKDPDRSQRIFSLRTESAAAMVDDAIHAVDTAPIDRDSISKAKVKADLRVKVAGFIDREKWGEQKQSPIQVNILATHESALRHRLVVASAPLAVALGQTGNLQLVGGENATDAKSDTRTEQTEASESEACETEPEETAS